MEDRLRQSVTELLADVRSGRAGADQELASVVYGELHRMAERQLGRERAGHTLQATDLVHETWLRMLGRGEWECADRDHFFAVAARTIRVVLVDHARRRGALKRGGGAAASPLTIDLAGEEGTAPIDLVALDEALQRLAQLDARQAQMVELRFFGGLTVEATAKILGVSCATVKRDWELVRAWLYRRLYGR